MKSFAIKNDAVIAALDVAVKGNTDKLFAELTKGSGLPGVRANLPLAQAFADECSRRGKATDALLTKLASLDPEKAPGGTPFEFLPMCGVLGLAARGAADKSVRADVLSMLHELADDMRFRVREAVILSLDRLATAMGEELLIETQPWMDGFFHAAAVLTALARHPLLNETHDAALVCERLREAADLICDAPRSSMRYPGYKALMDALKLAAGPLASRHGTTVLDEVKRWTTVGSVDLRELATAAVRDPKLSSRFLDAVTGIRASHDANVPVPRDGKKMIVRATRKRGKRH